MDGIDELSPSFGRAYVIARPAAADAEHAAGFIANNRGGAGLAAVDAEEVLGHENK
jgi:hypothetical protein